MHSLGGYIQLGKVFFFDFKKIFGENFGGKDAYNFQK